MKLTVIVYDEQSDLYRSSIHNTILRDFHMLCQDEYDESCQNLPVFDYKWFYKKLVAWLEYKGDYYVFISRQMTQQELGRVEHCIFTLTGLRGIGNHINNLEFLAPPNTPMKKFLLKRV